MTKTKKLYGSRWAIVKSDGRIARDSIGHRPAIYASRKTAKDMLEDSIAPGGVKVRDLSRSL